MNIVKGVVHLIRKSSVSHTPESGVGSSSERFLLPSTKIYFSEIGEEAILSKLWGKYIDAFDKVERQKLFLMFLKQFLIVYKNWKPVDPRQSPEAAASDFSLVECSQHDDVIFGCSVGHPAEIILALTEEISHITAMVSELTSSNMGGVILTTERLGTVTGLTLTSEGLAILDALTIVTRSMYNCNVFSYYSGIQKVTALMKAAVGQLKTITSALPEVESLSNSIIEKIAVLQNLLRHVVLIICSFINLHSDVYEITQPYFNFSESSFPKAGSNLFRSSGGTTVPSEARAHWHQKAVVSVIEAGGLNWLVGKIWLTPQLQSAGNFTFSSAQDPTFGIGSDILSSRKIGSPLAECIELGAQCFATLQTTTENFLISCGNWENSFQVISLFDGRMEGWCKALDNIKILLAVLQVKKIY